MCGGVWCAAIDDTSSVATASYPASQQMRDLKLVYASAPDLDINVGDDRRQLLHLDGPISCGSNTVFLCGPEGSTKPTFVSTTGERRVL